MYTWNDHEMLVVDADSHVIEPPGAWDPYVTARFRDRTPRLVRDDDTDWLELDGARLSSYAMLSGLARGNRGIPDADGAPKGRWEDDILPGAYAVGPRLADMARDGIDAAVVYPTIGMSFYGLADRALAFELQRAYNRWIADFCAGAPDRLKGVAMIMPDDPDAAGEMERCRAAGLVQVLVPLPIDDRPFSDPAWDRIWSAANALAMPVAVHAFAGRRDRRARSDTLVEALVDRTADMERALVALVFGGVLDRYDQLRFVSVENEAGWAASLIDRADVSYRRGRRTGTGLAGCSRMPGEIFRERISFTIIHDQTAIDARRVIGTANLMWSTDYPHNSSTWPNSFEQLSGSLRPELHDDEVAAIVGGNAAALYGIDTPAPIGGGVSGRR